MLQQSASLRPFPWEPFAFREIACSAGQDEVTDVIGGNTSTYNTRKWEGMLNMIRILALLALKFGMAVVTTIALAFEQISNLGWCMRACYVLLTSLAILITNTFPLIICRAFSQGFSFTYSTSPFQRTLVTLIAVSKVFLRGRKDVFTCRATLRAFWKHFRWTPMRFSMAPSSVPIL